MAARTGTEPSIYRVRSTTLVGEHGQALARYEEVKDKFSDAEEASDYFLEKRLSLPEVTTLSLSDDVVVPVHYRNLKEVGGQGVPG